MRAFVATSLALTLFGVAPVEPDPSPAIAARPPATPSVPVQPVVARQPAPDLTAAAAQNWSPRRDLPRPGVATVDLSGTPANSTDSLPVRLDRAVGLRRIQVEVAAPEAAERAGIRGALVRLTPVDTPARGAKVRTAIDYRDFANAYGADWSRRLRLIRLPACAWTTPDRPGCLQVSQTASTNDRSSVSATVPLSRESVVLATAAGPSSDVGDYSATPLTASATWSAGGSAGDFSWSYPLAVPPGVGGPEPQLTLAYSAQSVDGRTAATNNQPSWVGEGFHLADNYIERKYGSCSDDGHKTKGDLCWKHENATVSFNGSATELVRDESGTWRLEDDDGSRVEYHTGASNGDNNGEHWTITSDDGTRYVFGKHLLAAGQPVTNSVWTVPVSGDDAGEPCHGADFAASFCTQAWRWNLDYVVDPHGNAMTYWYVPETNYYAKNADPSPGTVYNSGGYLRRIDYGQRADTLFTATAPMRVVFDVADRVNDIPTDQVCNAGQTCTDKLAPTFFTRKRLAKVTTNVFRSTAYDDVDVWTLSHTYPVPGDGTDPVLWLSQINHGGRANGGTLDLPPVTFAGTPKENRVDAYEGVAEMIRYRIERIVSETGGELRVEYLPTECVRSAVPTPETNTKRCFPSYWSPQGAYEPRQDWFHKYVVSQVLETDLTGGGRQMLTQYGYGGGAAWRYDPGDGLTPAKYRTWSQWRGYGTVTTTGGDATEGVRSQTSALYFRGMDGDRATPSGGAKNVDVTDSEGGVLADADQFAGFIREARTFNGPGGPEVSAETKLPWSRQTAFRDQTWGDARAHLVREQTVRTRTALDGGRGPRHTTLGFSYTDDGLVSTANDQGDDAVSGDERCSRTWYAQNRVSWLIDYESRVEQRAGSCATTGALIADDRTAYDGLAIGAAPTRGNPTRIERAASVSAGITTYQTVSTRTFDSHGRVTADTNADARTTRTAYTPATGGPLTRTVVTNPLSHADTTTQDPAWGVPTVTLDANGKRSELSYDALGRLTAVWLPDRPRADGLAANLKFGYATSRTAASAVSTSTLRADGVNYNTSYQLYDSLLRERQTQRPAPGGGRIIADLVYDSRGLVSRQRADFYNSAAPSTGLVTTLDADTPALTTSVYDGAERKVRETLNTKGALRWSTATSYGGDRTYVDPPAGAPGTTTITDARGNVLERRDHPGGAPSGAFTATKYGYDIADRMTSLVDAEGNRWGYTFDLRGRKIEARDPDKGTSTSTYDSLDHPATSTDARGRTVATSYDELGRKKGLFEGSVTGPKLAEWTYDTIVGAKGLPVASIRYAGGQAYKREVVSYDDRYRATRSQVVIPTTEGALAGTYRSGVDYDADGAVHAQYLPNVAGLPIERLVYERNELGLAETLTADPERVLVTSTIYSKLGDPEQLKLPIVIDPTSVSKYLDLMMTYEVGTRRLTRATANQTGQEQISDRNYTYDHAGNVTSVQEVAGASVPDELECYRHDGHRRLLDVWTQGSGSCSAGPSQSVLGGPAPYWQSWTYTAAGMRASQTDHAATGDTTSTYAYPAAGQPRAHAVSTVTTGGVAASFGYDATGNTTSRKNPATGAVQALAWDTEGRLDAITEAGKSTRNIYDAEGNLLIRRAPTETVLHLDDTEAQLSGGVVSGTRYYKFEGKTVAVRKGSSVDLLITDHHNTPLASVDIPTQAVQRRRETPFGTPRTTSTGWPSSTRGFIGGVRDDGNQLVHLGARDYDPLYGRFLSVDPVLAPEQSQSLNGYGYAGNNPSTNSDPTGLRYRDRDDGSTTGSGPGKWGGGKSGGKSGGKKATPRSNGETRWERNEDNKERARKSSWRRPAHQPPWACAFSSYGWCSNSPSPSPKPKPKPKPPAKKPAPDTDFVRCTSSVPVFVLCGSGQTGSTVADAITGGGQALEKLKSGSKAPRTGPKLPFGRLGALGTLLGLPSTYSEGRAYAESKPGMSAADADSHAWGETWATVAGATAGAAIGAEVVSRAASNAGALAGGFFGGPWGAVGGYVAGKVVGGVAGAVGGGMLGGKLGRDFYRSQAYE